MFPFDIIWNWIVTKILDKIFSKKNENMKIIEFYEERLKKHEQKIDELEKEKGDIKKSWERDLSKKAIDTKRVIASLKRKGLSTDKLIERYDRPLNAILLSYASQKMEIKRKNGKSTYLKAESFMRERLQKFDAKWLGGTDFIIPPSKIPGNVTNKTTLKKWFETKVLKNGYCKIKLLALIDLKKDVVWKNYLPYKQKKPLHYTIGEKLDIQDLFTEEEIINKLALARIIRDGDIGWLASSTLSEKELEIIHRNQTAIEKSLRNPSLRLLSDNKQISKISKVLAEYNIKRPREVAEAIVEEAKFWNEKLR